MKMSYENLSLAALEGARIGKWHGRPVYTCAREDYWKYEHESALYIIYDEQNLLIENGLVVGRVKLNGDVEERRPLPYYFSKPKPKEEEVKWAVETDREIDEMPKVNVNYEELFKEVMEKDPLDEMKKLYGLE
jgi:hypothetical protein